MADDIDQLKSTTIKYTRDKLQNNNEQTNGVYFKNYLSKLDINSRSPSGVLSPSIGSVAQVNVHKNHKELFPEKSVLSEVSDKSKSLLSNGISVESNRKNLENKRSEDEHTQVVNKENGLSTESVAHHCKTRESSSLVSPLKSNYNVNRK